jgi:NADPH:quinone reductase-like Zn-dependent oxidoreductase
VRGLVVTDGELRIEERATPVPEGDEVLVEVAAAGLNRADTIQARGLYPAPPGWPPDIPGLEFAGKVVGTGRGIKLCAREIESSESSAGAHTQLTSSPKRTSAPRFQESSTW